MQKLNVKKNRSTGFGITVLLIFAVSIYLIFKILTPNNFGSLANLSSYAQQCIIQATAACGFYFIMVMGLFDFSLGSNIILSAIVGSICASVAGYPGLILGAIICGSLIGLINGIIYIRLKIPSIIVTVGMMMLYECIASMISQGKLMGISRDLQAFARTPWNYLLAVIAFALAVVILRYTKIGTYTYAIGSNESVAKNMGIRVDKYKVLAFAICGGFVGIMSILTISYGSSIQAETGMASGGRNYIPVMGCFFGMAFKQYNCPITAIVVGEFIIYMMLNGLLALGVPSTIQNVIVGAILLLIVAVTTKRVKGTVVK
ncbi:ribose import permease protein RbsC [Lachnospiraceae bacterium]|nr:ribose import permease protein RbsC [Lachnospiraceae bacterium]